MNFIRKIVSGKKRRFVKDNFNLDLSYITPRIIAMALPATGFSKAYRNKINDVYTQSPFSMTNQFRLQLFLRNTTQGTTEYTTYVRRDIHMDYSKIE
jgi:hypothetical protein